MGTGNWPWPDTNGSHRARRAGAGETAAKHKPAAASKTPRIAGLKERETKRSFGRSTQFSFYPAKKPKTINSCLIASLRHLHHRTR